MAMILCDECGRAVSDKAAACVGCGAPIASRAPLQPSRAPQRVARPAIPSVPASARLIRRNLALALATLALGLAASSLAERTHGAGRLPVLAAALLLIAGLAGTLVWLVRWWAEREPVQRP